MNILKLRILMLIDKFHKATDVAEALQVKQPTVSFHMKSLEKEMGVSLFSLQQGRIMLTEAGKKLLPYAKQIISLEQEARQAVDELTEESQGQLHLGAESISGTYLLPTLMAKFAEGYPDIRIQLEIQSPDAIRQLLKQGEIDFAFLDDRGSLPEYTVAEPVASDQVGVIRSARAPEVKLEEFDGTDMLDKHTWVKYSGSSVVDLYSSLVKPHLEINSWEAVKQVVSGGEALAFFPASGIDNHENAVPPVEWLPYPEADNKRSSHYQINIVYQQDTHMNLMQQAFLDFIRREGLEIKS
ncbi:LysR family transcriptional regulator [Paenibacillus polymyxa]|uniref:LysR family transcriptional regulator n=1 Tax=Paenibacillus polymyxa TaxID=1406 RepID=UPI0004D80A76|nr:LysR family transcriptional regulator [Paenibacillus polymyxa]KEO80575.1 transcriptional regulator [Paenibacillus polymyxa]MCH6186693.1 LysR family transcriptional regulator [Paenibacillus polymyxa]WRL60329.1 LysR family transcriptional regulator [Paenibacillus polymyxa]